MIFWMIYEQETFAYDEAYNGEYFLNKRDALKKWKSLKRNVEEFHENNDEELDAIGFYKCKAEPYTAKQLLYYALNGFDIWESRKLIDQIGKNDNYGLIHEI